MSPVLRNEAARVPFGVVYPRIPLSQKFDSVKFADSPLEQAGFEPPVPRLFRSWPGRPGNDLDQREGDTLPFRGGPTVRIRFPPAESPRTIGSAGDFTGSMSGRSHLFRRIVQGRDAGGMIATRCLASILAADVAGYSRLIGATTGIIAAIARVTATATPRQP